MIELKNIVVIGTGNLAQHIVRSFKDISSLTVVQIFNHRSSKTARVFAEENNCKLITDYNRINKNAAVYFICVKDDVIGAVAVQLTALNLAGLVVHTSGSTAMNILENVSTNFGVYYPLQTFSVSANISWQKTPILIEASNRSSLKILRKIGSGVSTEVKTLNSEVRLKLHLAAVFVANFTNALHTAAFQYIEKNLAKKDTALLLPLIRESCKKLDRLHPFDAQTGPAIRNDITVMKKHLSLLKNDKEMHSLYKMLSDLIIKQRA